MMSSSVRALRVCVILALPTAAFAQSTKGPTIFAKTAQLGSVALRAAVVLPDYSVKPLALLRIVVERADKSDTASAETDLDGRLSIGLPVGTYTVRARTAQPVAGRSYSWAVRVVVRPQHTETVQLTNTNAITSDADATNVVAEAAAKPVTPAPQPAPPAAVVKSPSQRPAQPVGGNSDNNKVVATNVVAKTAPAAQPSPFEPPRSAPAPSAPARVSSSAPARHVQPKANRADPEGFLFGLAFDAASIRADDAARTTESGPGAGMTFGWGFTKNFALVLDASAARISSLNGDYNLGHVDLGGRWHFVNRSALVPFLDVGYAGRVAQKQDVMFPGATSPGNVSMMGSGPSAGGGFEYFATPGLALGGSFKWTGGKFTRVRFDNVTVDGLSIDATSARFNMGFTWYPSH